MDLSTENEDVPPPFLQRRSTWIVAAAGCVAIALCGWWLRSNHIATTVKELGARHQYDSAWSALRSSQSGMGDCERFGLTGNLAMLDERTDTLLLRMADSIKACSVPPDSLLEYVSLGNLRIANHSHGLDSSAMWRLQANVFRSASECVKADSSNKPCRDYGFAALSGMKDSYGQLAWIQSALVRWPTDSHFLAMQAEAAKANALAKLAVVPTPVENKAEAVKATKKKTKHH